MDGGCKYSIIQDLAYKNTEQQPLMSLVKELTSKRAKRDRVFLTIFGQKVDFDKTYFEVLVSVKFNPP